MNQRGLLEASFVGLAFFFKLHAVSLSDSDVYIPVRWSSMLAKKLSGTSNLCPQQDLIHMLQNHTINQASALKAGRFSRLASNLHYCSEQKR